MGTLITGPFKIKRTSAQVHEYPKLSIESYYATDHTSVSLTFGDIFYIFLWASTTAYHIVQTSNVVSNSAKTGKVKEILKNLTSKQSLQISRNLQTLSEKSVF